MTMFCAVVAEDVCKGGCVMEVDNIVEEIKELAKAKLYKMNLLNWIGADKIRMIGIIYRN